MKNTLLLAFVILLAIIPFYIHRDSEFGGADGQAEEAIQEIAPEYTPWVQALWEPPGGETESLLFSLQAAIGSLVIGYVIGFGRARKKYSNNAESK
ncbi:energy-coupling factor ABC transporter substrate-binding protein [Peribacillus saganii]|uniref:Cobalt transport protein CbiN n=1 Tax=Peribacillus saganii TaxID=2303992 RepID=A0A372LF38_9BACI|nr:energy-coupling factor ABC transporter substrate-binding protein [Peribacillus saganii]RFU64511.1 energy-coupling factor ABC transporter substrate-binding protein [Peribacillus saganii]